jgi:hypothetical protein
MALNMAARMPYKTPVKLKTPYENRKIKLTGLTSLQKTLKKRYFNG